jgi:hypothetical protein
MSNDPWELENFKDIYPLSEIGRLISEEAQRRMLVYIKLNSNKLNETLTMLYRKFDIK